MKKLTVLFTAVLIAGVVTATADTRSPSTPTCEYGFYPGPYILIDGPFLYAGDNALQVCEQLLADGAAYAVYSGH